MELSKVDRSVLNLVERPDLYLLLLAGDSVLSDLRLFFASSMFVVQVEALGAVTLCVVVV